MIQNILKSTSRFNKNLTFRNLNYINYNYNNNNGNNTIIKFYTTTTTNNNNNNNNNNDNKNKSNVDKKPFYGSIGDIDFSKKQHGPSATSSLSKEQISKSLLLMRRSATLSSVYMMAKMSEENQTPIYGSLVPYALNSTMEMVKTDITDESKEELFTVYNPIIALHKDSPHIKHFKHFNKVSMVIYPLTPVGKAPSEYDLERINISGRAIKVDGSNSKYDLDKIRKIYYDRNPKSKSVVENNRESYEFYVVELSDIYHYNRNSKLTSIPLNTFKSARADPITIQSSEVIETVNSKYQDSLVSIVEQYGDVKIESAFMYFLDSHGLNCIGKKKDAEEWFDIRVPFDTSFDTLENCKDGLYGTLKELKTL